jgi:hypothetical protein
MSPPVDNYECTVRIKFDSVKEGFLVLKLLATILRRDVFREFQNVFVGKML